MIIQLFSNSMTFPCMELFFSDFPELVGTLTIAFGIVPSKKSDLSLYWAQYQIQSLLYAQLVFNSQSKDYYQTGQISMLHWFIDGLNNAYIQNTLA